MADVRKRLANNVPGEFFVDATCINCDTCRQLAPLTFGEAHGHSFVKGQPGNGNTVRDATRALLACPTASIGTLGKNIAKEVVADFPLAISEGVYLCGFNSPKSYGANSYFVTHADGNWLIDSPRYVPQLAAQFKALGGMKYIFLTHRDDVSDAQQYAAEFQAMRIIHEEDRQAQPDAEILLHAFGATKFGNDFQVIPTPGHTRGHCVLLYKNKYLFTGDHLSWDRDTESLESREDVCWYNFSEQKQSVKLLEDYTFEWILPGHGQSIQLPSATMQEKLHELVLSMG